MGSRRRRRRTSAPMFEKVVWPLTMVIVGVLTVLLFRGIGSLFVYIFNRKAPRATTPLTGLQDFPGQVMDLWPTHGDQDSVVMKSCIGKHCYDEEHTGNTLSYMILRPLGELGDIFEQFVKDHVPMSELELSFDNFIPEVPYAAIIRPAIQPLLLSAIDVALETTGEDFPAENITVPDLIAAMSDIAAWHCQIYSDIQFTEVLTIPFDRMLAYPEEAEKQLDKFLKISHEKQKKQHVNMENLAKRAFNRIDQHHAFLSKIEDAEALKHAAKALDAELQSHFCKNIHYDESDSRVAEILGRFLSFPYDKFDRKLCRKYPAARLCIEYAAINDLSIVDDQMLPEKVIN